MDAQLGTFIRSPQDPAFNTQKDGWILLPGDMGPRGVGALAQQKWFKDVRSELSNGRQNRHFAQNPGLQGTAEYELCLRKKLLKQQFPKISLKYPIYAYRKKILFM